MRPARVMPALRMNAEEQSVLAGLIRGQRWAALATLSDGAPMASMVAYVTEADFSGFLLHLSRLAPHTRNLLAVPRASLVISEPDSGQGDPQLLARVTIQGTVVQLPRNTAGYAGGRERYLGRLPDAERLFDFPDFVLFRLVPSGARYIGGFARAYSLGVEQLRAAARVVAERPE